MKKGKFIAGALVLSMGLLGTGYAYWTDALSVSTTVSTGNFEIDFVKAEDTDRTVEFLANIGGTDEYKEAHTNGNEPFITIDNTSGNTMKLGVSNMYPGTYVEFPYEVHNSSTIPMILEDVAVTLENIDPALNNLGVIIRRENVTNDGETSHSTAVGEGVTLKDKLIDAFTKAYAEIPTEMKKTLDSITISAVAGADEISLPEQSSLEFDIELNWGQDNIKR